MTTLREAVQKAQPEALRLAAVAICDRSIGWQADATAELRRLHVENERLRTVMVAAAEEIAEHWEAHCDAEGYGPVNLMRRLEEGIAAEYGYTAGEFARLRSQRDALLEACKTLVHLRETEDWMETLHKAVNQARAAIKSAEEKE